MDKGYNGKWIFGLRWKAKFPRIPRFPRFPRNQPGQKIIVNQILLSKLWYIDQIYSIPKYIKIHRSTSHKNLRKQNNEDFFIQLLNAWLHLTNNNFPAHMSIEKILDQSIFLNPHARLDFSSDNAYLYSIPPRNISDKLTIFWDLCRFLKLADF